MKSYSIQWYHESIPGIFTGPTFSWKWRAKLKCWLANKTLNPDGKRAFFVTENDYELQAALSIMGDSNDK